MKHACMIFLCSALVILGDVPAVRAQTAEEIIARHIEALGGKEKLQSIKTLYIEGTAVMQNGTEISSKTWKVKDRLYRQEISFGMGSMVTIATPSKGWASSPRSNGEFKPMTDDQLKLAQTQMDPAGPFVEYAAKGSKVELLGKDTVAGKECYKVKLTPASGPEIVYSFDEQSYYILREVRKGSGMTGGGGGGGRPGGGDGSFRIEFGDYQKTPDGFVFPFTIIAGGFGAKSSVEKLEVNKPVDEATLGKPGN